jgi:hypothetical protein
VSATARVKLAGGGDGTTTLTYDADAVVGGMVGGVGQRVLTGVAKKTAAEFFAAVDDGLNGTVPARTVPAPAREVAAASVVGSGVVEPGAQPAVYTRPPAPVRGLPGGDFAAGVLFGAAAALAGALVGGLIARSNRRGRI